MGRIDNTKLVYVSGGLIIGIFVLLAMLLGSKSKSFLASEKGQPRIIKTSQGHTYISGAAPKSSWKSIQNTKTSQAKAFQSAPHDSGYTPGASYANNYVRPQDVNHPLIASAKFIKKKDKLKNKKKKASALSKGKSRFGGSENNEDELEPTPDSTSKIVSMAGATTPQAAQKKKAQEEEENINTVEFWVEPIFVNQDPQAVDKLVTSFKMNKVSSSVFYTVVTQMNEDSRPNIREMGISALAVNPSTESFSQLSWAKHNDTEAELRTEAGQHVATYTDVSKLGYVVSALKSPEKTSPTVTVEALRTITASTQKYSDLHILDNGNPGNNSAAALSTLEPRFNRALELIEQNNLSSSNNTTLKTEATKTVTAINKFMSI